MTSTYIFGIIVGKLSYWKELSPIILLIIDKNPEVNFYYTVLPFSLAISLKVQGNREPLFDFQKVTE